MWLLRVINEQWIINKCYKGYVVTPDSGGGKRQEKDFTGLTPAGVWE